MKAGVHGTVSRAVGEGGTPSRRTTLTGSYIVGQGVSVRPPALEL
jgi:hypothetical protein